MNQSGPRRSRRLAGLPPHSSEQEDDISDLLVKQIKEEQKEDETSFKFIVIYLISYLALVFYIYYANRL